MVPNLSYTVESPRKFKQHQCSGLAPRDFDLIGVGWAQHGICVPDGRDQGTEYVADAIYNC